MSRDETIQRIGSQQLLFAPGADRRYSNSGYTLLALAIEAASGQPFAQYVRQKLLAPASMASAGFYGDGRWAHGRVSHGTGRDSFLGNAPERWPEPMWTLVGSGGMIATPRDLASWIRAVHSGRILDPTEQRKMYGQREWAVYAGGNSLGQFETIVLEFDHGDDFVILHTNSGLGQIALAMSVAEAGRGPLPESMKVAMGGVSRPPRP